MHSKWGPYRNPHHLRHRMGDPPSLSLGTYHPSLAGFNRIFFFTDAGQSLTRKLSFCMLEDLVSRAPPPFPLPGGSSSIGSLQALSIAELFFLEILHNESDEIDKPTAQNSQGDASSLSFRNITRHCSVISADENPGCSHLKPK